MKRILVIGLVFLFSNLAQAQESLQDICKKHIEMAGGEEKLKRLSSITYQQQILSNNMEAPQTVIVVDREAFFSETVFPGRKIQVGVKGKAGWQVNPFTGSSDAKDLSDKEISAYRNQMDLKGPIYSFLYEPGVKIDSLELKGKSKVGREECHVIQINYKNGFKEDVFISTKNYALLKIKNAYGEVLFSNYKSVDGVLFPFNKEIIGSTGSLFVQVIAVKTNQEIDSQLFKKP